MKQIDFSTLTTESGFCSIFPDRDGPGRSRKWWVDTSDIVAEESFQQSQKISLDEKFTPQKSHAEFPNLENFQNAFKSDITCCSLFGCTLFAEQRGRDTQALLQIFRLFWKPQKSLLKSSHHPTPPPPPPPGHERHAKGDANRLLAAL